MQFESVRGSSQLSRVSLRGTDYRVKSHRSGRARDFARGVAGGISTMPMKLSMVLTDIPWQFAAADVHAPFVDRMNLYPVAEMRQC
jgi:hypothetical protein